MVHTHALPGNLAGLQAVENINCTAATTEQTTRSTTHKPRVNQKQGGAKHKQNSGRSDTADRQQKPVKAKQRPDNNQMQNRSSCKTNTSKLSRVTFMKSKCSVSWDLRLSTHTLSKSRLQMDQVANPMSRFWPVKVTPTTDIPCFTPRPYLSYFIRNRGNRLSNSRQQGTGGLGFCRHAQWLHSWRHRRATWSGLSYIRIPSHTGPWATEPSMPTYLCAAITTTYPVCMLGERDCLLFMHLTRCLMFRQVTEQYAAHASKVDKDAAWEYCHTLTHTWFSSTQDCLSCDENLTRGLKQIRKLIPFDLSNT